MNVIEELQKQIQNSNRIKYQDKQLDLSPLMHKYWRNGVSSELGYPKSTVSKKDKCIDITYKHSHVVIKPHPTIHSMWEYTYTYTDKDTKTKHIETNKSIVPYSLVYAKLTLLEQRRGEPYVG